MNNNLVDNKEDKKESLEELDDIGTIRAKQILDLYLAQLRRK